MSQIFLPKTSLSTMALETECISRPNKGTSTDAPDVPSPTSMSIGMFSKYNHVTIIFQ